MTADELIDKLQDYEIDLKQPETSESLAMIGLFEKGGDTLATWDGDEPVTISEIVRACLGE